MSTPSPTSTADLALHFLETRSPSHPTSSSASLLSQISHRQKIISYFSIPAGSRVLEIGCGQGDTTIVLADTVGPSGHIDALDPGSPDYGSPFTLSQAQSHILSSPLGPRITFHNTSPLAYLTSYTGPPYDFIIFVHSTYYFATPSVLPSILAIPLLGTPRICIAEWSLRARTPVSYPHVLVVLVMAMLENMRRGDGSGNVRTVMAPARLREVVGERYGVVREEYLGSGEGMRDGVWEVGYILRREREGRVFEGVEAGEGMRGVVGAMVGALGEAVEGLGGVEGVECMDVWVGVFS
ncbi:S-adenosyl-L-methionine-dependent methyltransferase [Glarea lozoyensis ATCC 20868]|uniref:S-adenosyl-L-methionine-dependent methyltransferase n=1 Tax=Glarea lozoyensis (strain ATCC 20868 / MF5171) TaxID=1116229 RepID=S3CWK2_GLAL2|nr:S-adenosyl-L-methionine-dependent methyltransferase [Glarea lozoyensis ATCC 20868]EPE30035.1 S-adenosyl-L-methionine-dependent methyltransferase [Glarea lozoyensis ATCC 20868]